MEFINIKLDQDVVFRQRTAYLTEHDLHMHDVLEISVVLENNMIHRMLKGDSVGKPGDVFMLRPFELHWNLTEHADKPAEWIMILFSPSLVGAIPQGVRLLAPFYTVKWNSHIPANTPEARAICHIALLAVQEGKSQLPGWETKQLLYALDILVHIYRYFLSLTPYSTGEKESEPNIVKSIEALLEGYRSDIGMERIIRLSGLKKTRFYQQFCNITGLTPNDFVNRLRLQYAVQQLRNTSKSVTDIAFESGFNSVSYFNKQFKDWLNVTPREYRNR